MTVMVPTFTVLPPDWATTVMGKVTDVAPAGMVVLPAAVVLEPAAPEPVEFDPKVCLPTAPPQEVITAARARTIVIAAIARAITQNPRLMCRANAAPRAVSGKSPRARTIGKVSRGPDGVIPVAGAFVICAVSVELTLPLTGKKKELGANLHVTAAGALQASWNCPVRPLVPVMVTVKVAVPPTEIVAAAGDTWPATTPTVS